MINKRKKTIRIKQRIAVVEFMLLVVILVAHLTLTFMPVEYVGTHKHMSKEITNLRLSITDLGTMYVENTIHVTESDASNLSLVPPVKKTFAKRGVVVGQAY